MSDKKEQENEAKQDKEKKEEQTVRRFLYEFCEYCEKIVGWDYSRIPKFIEVIKRDILEYTDLELEKFLDKCSHGQWSKRNPLFGREEDWPNLDKEALSLV